MRFLDKPTLYADNGSFFQKKLFHQTEKSTLSEINLLFLFIATTAYHIPDDPDTKSSPKHALSSIFFYSSQPQLAFRI